MCGILGFIKPTGYRITIHKVKEIIKELMLLSESRGTEASGLAMAIDDKILVSKIPYSASKFTKMRYFSEFFDSIESAIEDVDNSFAIIGHVRMVTDGSEHSHENNQPVAKNGLVGVHNGIIVNAKELSSEFDIPRESAVDTEVLLGVMAQKLEKKEPISQALNYAFGQIYGTASIAVLFRKLNAVLLATNNGSLYTYSPETEGALVFASEHFILNQFVEHMDDVFPSSSYSIKHLNSGHSVLIGISDAKRIKFEVGTDQDMIEQLENTDRNIVDISPRVSLQPWQLPGNEDDDPSLLYYNPDAISKLKRCTNCILPETFPFIEFDENGVCNYCRDYEKLEYLGADPLRELADSIRQSDGAADCMVMLSGGRDSSYTLHYVKNELDLNPIAYTYDWGMVTDIARRNISRLCAKMGVEHILVSADIREKRSNIQKNVLAWLKKPDLGMVPLFMAGDKHWYYYANRVTKQLNLPAVFLSTNDLERTHFKIGFCGIPPIQNDLRRGGGTIDKLHLISYYGYNMLRNPYYLNRSIPDTLSGFLSFYQAPRSYIRFFEYVKWDESRINKTLIEEYDWETDPETSTTWRIGDGTAQFYNYIYHTIAGFSENDTFRSNQIREGLINRQQALEAVREENKPRYNGIKWYLTAIGLQNYFNYVIRKINSAPKLYDDE